MLLERVGIMQKILKAITFISILMIMCMLMSCAWGNPFLPVYKAASAPSAGAPAKIIGPNGEIYVPYNGRWQPSWDSITVGSTDWSYANINCAKEDKAHNIIYFYNKILDEFPCFYVREDFKAPELTRQNISSFQMVLTDASSKESIKGRIMTDKTAIDEIFDLLESEKTIDTGTRGYQAGYISFYSQMAPGCVSSIIIFKCEEHYCIYNGRGDIILTPGTIERLTGK